MKTTGRTFRWFFVFIWQGEARSKCLYLQLVSQTMLNRRILRVKAFQNLYAYEQCKGSNFNLAKDYIKESFLPDLNSMEVQDKAALSRDAQSAIQLFEQSVDSKSQLQASDGSPKIKKVVLEAINTFHSSNKKDQDFLLKNMIASAERIPQLYLLAIELLQAFSKQAGTEIEKKKKLQAGNPVAFANELNLTNNRVLANLRESDIYRAAVAKNNANLDDLELEIREWFRDYIKPSEEYQAYIKLSNPSVEEDLHAADVADLIENLDTESRNKLIEIEAFNIEPEIFIELNESLQSEVLILLTPDSVAKILRKLESDNALQILEKIEDACDLSHRIQL